MAINIGRAAGFGCTDPAVRRSFPERLKGVWQVLVLSRQCDEQIVIGEGANQVVVTIVDIRGDKVRLGIEAVKEIPVHRREVYEAIQREVASKNERNQSDGHAA